MNPFPGARPLWVVMNSRLIDVRSASEFASGHIPGAENIPLEQIEFRIADLQAAPALTLVCKSGHRARMAAGRLAAHGLKAELFPGGTQAWIAGGHPVVRTLESRWSLERQTRLGAGVITLAGALLAWFADPAWVALCAFTGAGHTLAGSTDTCLMGIVLGRMPWNQARKPSCTC